MASICGTFPHAEPMAGGVPEPQWGMSLRAAGDMRFCPGGHNAVRDQFLGGMAQGRQVCAVTQVHSRVVIAARDASDVAGVSADGIITQNRSLMPVVTVADCMPVFLYEPRTGVFGALHSGWRGTGIVADAITLAGRAYGSRAQDFLVVLGPHIGSCCYAVDGGRAMQFARDFGAECVTELGGVPYLSLTQANLGVLSRLGVDPGNITVRPECTCCDDRFGSFRRQTAHLAADLPLEQKRRHFTLQAAWVRW